MLTKKTNTAKRTLRVRISEADWQRYEAVKERAAAMGYETHLDNVLARVVRREVGRAEKTLDAAEQEHQEESSHEAGSASSEQTDQTPDGSFSY